MQDAWNDWPEIARWTVAPDEPACAGHFPGQPLVPGALLLDWAVEQVELHAQRRVARVLDAKFLRPVTPGAALVLHAEAAAARARFVIATTETGAPLVASGQLQLAPQEA